MDIDPLLLSRLQFGVTASFHIIFPCLIIGLAFYLAILEFQWLRTKQAIYRVQYQFWLYPFAVVFMIGMITGIVLSFQLDTTFGEFYVKTAAILAPIRHVELANVVFFEGGTLGIMIWGERRVGTRLHFVATLMMVLGVLISAACITARNSWMQTPGGFALADGQILLQDWMTAIFSSSFPYRFLHMLAAAFLTTAFFVLGISAWFLIKKQYREFAQYNLRFTLIVILIMVPMQMFLGHLHGVNTYQNQPLKIAAIEALWETRQGAPFVLFGIPDQEAEQNRYSVEIPHLASLIITHDFNGKVIGLKDTPKAERPNVLIVYISFRVMIGISLLMLLVGGFGAVLMKKHRLYQSRWFLRTCVAMTPSGFIATIAGWCVSEEGRQPWTVYGLVKTAEIVTPTPMSQTVNFLSFIGSFYTILLLIFLFSLWWLIKRGPMQNPSFQLVS